MGPAGGDPLTPDGVVCAAGGGKRARTRGNGGIIIFLLVMPSVPSPNAGLMKQRTGRKGLAAKWAIFFLFYPHMGTHF